MDPPLLGFDFAVLDDPEFKEDAVREEIVAPVLRALGYQPSGRFRVIRSRPLEHPYVSIGSVKKAINIFPDYLLSVNDRLCWVLDAKAPNERVDAPDHISQAYSYAIHRDVRVEWFGLCNGRDLAVYNVADMSSTPRLRVQLPLLADSWDQVQQLLRPSGAVAVLSDYAKDFGIALLKLGTPATTRMYFVGIPVLNIGRVGESQFTFSGRTTAEGSQYQVSFDFDRSLLDDLLALFPRRDADRLLGILTAEGGAYHAVMIESQVPQMVTVAAHCGTQIQENDREHFLPLRVVEFRPYTAQQTV